MENEVTAYPLQWPMGHKRTQNPVRSKFKHNTFDRTRIQMLHELKLLGAREIIISTNIRLRLDGYPYAGDRPPEDKGIAIYFILFKEPCVFACDKYDRIEDNLYAVKMTVEALRGIDRWGVSEMLKRTFSGFKALPAAIITPHKRDWWHVMEIPETSFLDEMQAQYKRLVKLRHPDMPTGSKEAFQELQEAYQEALQERI